MLSERFYWIYCVCVWTSPFLQQPAGEGGTQFPAVDGVLLCVDSTPVEERELHAYWTGALQPHPSYWGDVMMM